MESSLFHQPQTKSAFDEIKSFGAWETSISEEQKQVFFGWPSWTFTKNTDLFDKDLEDQPSKGRDVHKHTAAAVRWLIHRSYSFYGLLIYFWFYLFTSVIWSFLFLTDL